MMRSLKHSVFWPPFLLLAGAATFSLLDGPTFVRLTNQLNDRILTLFSSWFAFSGLAAVGASLLAYLSPLGGTRIGGERAERLLKPTDWCAVVLCTNTAVGILFWATAEPLYHFTQPPKSLGILPGSPEAATFAMSTLFLHWSITPAAIYAVPALVFAIAFHNLKLPFSLASCFAPFIPKKFHHPLCVLLDSVCLFALATGMGASLGTGILSLAGGLEQLYGWKSDVSTWIPIGVVIVTSFVVSAATGLDRGIRCLSDVNAKAFFVLGAFTLALCPLGEVARLTGDGLAHYFSRFVSSSLLLELTAEDPWPRSWTIFYWSVWLAWAPVTALFLGRIGRGYTVRQFLLVNLAMPALFAIGWMGLFGGTALSFETSGNLGLSRTLATQGPESIAYVTLSQFPLREMVIPFFLFIAFVSYVTSADSNTSVMAGMSSKRLSEDAEPGLPLKILWGAILGILSIVMLCYSGVDGIRSISYLGGLPALFFELGVTIVLTQMALKSMRGISLPVEPAARQRQTCLP